MRRLLILLSALMLILISCDGTIKRSGRTILVSVVSDYTDSDIVDLRNPPNDQAALAGQIYALTDGNVELHLFRVENGKRYTAENVDDINTLFEYSTLIDRKIHNGKEIVKRIKPNLDNWDSSVPFDLQSVAATIEALDAGKNDLIIFQYSGHGVKDGTLILDENDSDMWGDANLIELMTGYNKDAKKVVILDSCFSGKHIKDGILSSNIDFKEVGSSEYYEGDSFFKSVAGSWDVLCGKDSYGTSNTYILAAASSEQLASDFFSGEVNQELFGAFSYYLFKALGFDFGELKPQNVNKEITFYSLYKEIWDNFPSSKKKEQTPLSTLSPFDLILF